MSVSESIKILEKYLESNEADEFTGQAIKKLISHSLHKEQKMLEELLTRLHSFEEKCGMQSADFHKQFHSGSLGDDEDFFVWDAIFEMNERIQTRIKILMGKD
jgi:hypothetical protein